MCVCVCVCHVYACMYLCMYVYYGQFVSSKTDHPAICRPLCNRSGRRGTDLSWTQERRQGLPFVHFQFNNSAPKRKISKFSSF